jgi:hypothetical protein
MREDKDVMFLNSRHHPADCTTSRHDGMGDWGGERGGGGIDSAARL